MVLPKIIVLTAARGGRSLTIITTPNVVEKFKNAMSEVRPHQLNTVAAYGEMSPRPSVTWQAVRLTPECPHGPSSAGRTIDYIHINRWPTTFPACTGMQYACDRMTAVSVTKQPRAVDRYIAQAAHKMAMVNRGMMNRGAPPQASALLASASAMSPAKQAEEKAGSFQRGTQEPDM